MEIGTESSKTRPGTLMWLGLGLILCAFAVVICYFFVDRQVVFLAHEGDWRRLVVLRGIQKIPHVVLWMVPLMIPWLVFRGLRRRWSRFDHFLLQMAVSLILTVLFKVPLKFLFGRTWPATFRDGNPSLIEDGVYGFFPFHHGIAYDAFPSGHTAAIAAAATVIWLTYPRWRYLAVALVGLSAAGVIGLYYHFVSDVVAGVSFGVTVGVGVCRLFPQPHWVQDGDKSQEAG